MPHAGIVLLGVFQYKSNATFIWLFSTFAKGY